VYSAALNALWALRTPCIMLFPPGALSRLLSHLLLLQALLLAAVLPSYAWNIPVAIFARK